MGTVMHDSRARKVLTVLLCGELALVASTWKLWFASSRFPRVALWTESVNLPAELSQSVSAWLIAAIVFASWCLIRSGMRSGDSRSNSAETNSTNAAIDPTPGPRVWLAVLVPAVLAACLNQHCLQPWHWLFIVAVGLRCSLGSADFLHAVRWLIGTSYLFAALSRLGPDIASGMSRQIMSTGLELTGLSFGQNTSSVVFSLCVLAVALEGTAGLMLMTIRWQKVGAVTAVAMHLFLIVVLGPAGMNQETGVLIWNVVLCVLVLLLSMKFPPQRHSGHSPSHLANVFCVLWPSLALMGVTHNWTGWQVYSPRPEVLQLQVRADHTGNLPDSLQPFIDAPRPLQDWCNIRLDRWSLSETGTPLYPQWGFQRAVAIWVTANITDSGAVRSRVDSPNVPLWWRRHSTEYASRAELAAH